MHVIIPWKQRQESKEWMLDEIHDLMKKRQQPMTMNGTEYRTLYRNKCKQVKDEYFHEDRKSKKHV